MSGGGLGSRAAPPPWVRLALSVFLLLPISKAQGQERFRKSPPLPDPFQELRLPKLESFRLRNGLTVTVAPLLGSPLVLMQLVIPAGQSHAPPDIPALAAFTARMISRGTRSLSADSLETAIESLGGDFSTSVAMDYTVFAFRVLKKDLDRALALLRAMILEPSFAEREVEAMRRDMFYELRAMAQNPEFLGRRQLLKRLFERHPYGTAGYGEDVIKLVGQRNVAAFYADHYRPDNAAFVISGDITLDEASAKISREFNTWAPGGLERRDLPSIAQNNAERICLVDFPAGEDALIMVGNSIPPLTGPDFFPFLVLNQILGGTTGSRLFMNLRESRGLAFDAFSDFDYFRSHGIYWAKARVPPEKVTPAISEILKELEGLSAERVGPAEIEAAKSFLIGNLPLRFESPSSYAARLSRKVGLGLGDEHWTGSAESLMRVDAQRVFEVAKKTYLPKPLVVIVGSLDLLAAGLIRDFDVVELADAKGDIIQTVRKGEIR